MTDARTAVSAKAITMMNPSSPSRLWRRLDHELRRNRLNPRANLCTVEAAEGARTSDADTRIEHSVQNVRDDVTEDHEDRNEE